MKVPQGLRFGFVPGGDGTGRPEDRRLTPLSTRSANEWARVALLPKQRVQLARALGTRLCSSAAGNLRSNNPIILDYWIGCAAKRLVPSLSAITEKDCSMGEAVGAKHMPRCNTKSKMV